MVAVGDDLAHQCGVVGGDVVADELRHVHEAHHPVVELDPVVHPAELDVADAVVDGLEQPLARRHRGLLGHVAGQVGAVVAGAVDQRVAGLAVRRDRRAPDRAVLVGDVVRLLEDGRALGPRVPDALVDVGDLEREVDHAVAVLAVVVVQRAVRGDAAVDHEAGRAGLQHERLVVAVAGLRARVRDEPHAERGLVEPRGLGGVADHEHHGVHRAYRERVLRLVVVDEPDELTELVEADVVELAFLAEGAGHRVLPAERVAVAAASVRLGSLRNRGQIRWTTCIASACSE